MKKLIYSLLILPFLALSAPNDIVVTQRNSTDTGLAPNRLVAALAGNANAIMGFNGISKLPVHWGVGSGLSISGTDLVSPPTDWSDITNKPVLFNGAYSSLTGVPTSFAPSAHTHNASDVVSGTFSISRIPSLPISQITGLQDVLDTKFDFPMGTSLQYLNGEGNPVDFPNIPDTQVNSDWLATSGSALILNKPVLFSGAYADLTGKPVIPAAQVNSDWASSSGVSQILNKPTLFSGSFADLTAKPTTLSGYGITDGATTSALTSGLATKFNNPTGSTAQYLRGDGSLATFPTIPGGTVTSITAGTGLSGGTITTTGTISLPNTGTAGTYSVVTTDAQGRVTAGRAKSFTYPTRSLNTAYQISTTQDASVVYTVDISVTSLLIAGMSGRVYLEYADNAAMTTNLVTVSESPNSISGVLNVSSVGPGNVSGWVPANKYVRIRTANIAGAPTFTFVRSQEVLE